jgi:hypothetical protein
MAQPMWESISTIFSMEEETRRGEVTRFSTPRRMPWEVATWMERGLGGSSSRVWGDFGWLELTPIAVEPSLMASSEYSTWKRRPSGEKVLESLCQGPSEHNIYLQVRHEGSYLMPRSGHVLSDSRK